MENSEIMKLETPIGKKFDLSRVEVNSYKLKIQEPQASKLKNLLLVPHLGGNLDELLDAVYSDDKLVKLVTTDTMINSLLWQSVYSKRLNSLHLDPSNIHDITVSYLDLGWDYYIDVQDATLGVYSGDIENDDDVITEINNIDHSLTQFNLFSYYTKFTSMMTEALKNIFGEAQECYLGFEDSFIIGFNVAGGSVITSMPIIGMHTYEIVSYSQHGSPYNPGNYNETIKVLFNEGKSFYGASKDHYYDTNHNRCKFTSIDIRLD